MSMPTDGEELLHAVPVCAPYAVLVGYKFKVKLTPGTQKKGKAAKQAVTLFTSMANSREKALIQAKAMPRTNVYAVVDATSRLGTLRHADCLPRRSVGGMSPATGDSTGRDCAGHVVERQVGQRRARSCCYDTQ